MTRIQSVLYDSTNASATGMPRTERPDRLTNSSFSQSTTCAVPRYSAMASSTLESSRVETPISDPSPLGRLPIQQWMISEVDATSRDTTTGRGLSTVTVPTDLTMLAVPDRTTDFESVGDILRRLRR